MEIVESIERYVAGTDLTPGTRTRLIRARDEIVRLRKALEQPARQESEAVRAAWMAGYTEGEREAFEQQEPVAYRSRLASGSYTYCNTAQFFDNTEPLYTRPQAREWVGLTDDEFEDIEMGCSSTPFGKIEAMKQVEAKLKEKNNG